VYAGDAWLRVATQAQEAQPDARPESELGRGLWAGSKGLLIALGVASLLMLIAVIIVVARVRARARAGDDVGPVSSRGGSVRPPPSSRPPRTP
jgi:hypothetical protein